MFKSRTIAELISEIGCDEGYLYAILAQLKISRKSDYTFTDQDLSQIKSVHENQLRSAPRLGGSSQPNGSQAQGLAEQAASAPATTQKPILKKAQERYSGAVQARDIYRQEIAVERLEEAQRRGQHTGALNAIVENTSMLDAEVAVATAIRTGELEGLARLDETIAKTLESADFLDRFTSTQQSYAERPIAPICNKARETLDVLKNLRASSNS